MESAEIKMENAEIKRELISVVIPAYNAEQTIERAVRSVLSQSYENTEIIVVDDGSKDGTEEVLSRLQKEDGRLHIIRKENAGVSAARNDGMKAATGAWLVTLDDDDYMDREMLSKLYQTASLQEAELVICGFRMVYESGKKQSFRPDEELTADTESFINSVFIELYDKHLISTHSNKLYNMALIRTHGIYYREGLSINEDIDFCLRYLEQCRTVSVVRGVFLNYVQHAVGESLITTFRENGVSSCFYVLEAYDRLFDRFALDDDCINAMNNRMLTHICSFVGLMYYRSSYSDERKQEEIRLLCDRADFQRLLSQTTPEGMKNKTAHFLLRHKRVKAYHGLCKLLYAGTKAGGAALSAVTESVETLAERMGQTEAEAEAAAPEVEAAEAENTAKAETEAIVTEAAKTEIAEETEEVREETSAQEADDAAEVEELVKTERAEEVLEPAADALETASQEAAEAEAEEEEEPKPVHIKKIVLDEAGNAAYSEESKVASHTRTARAAARKRHSRKYAQIEGQIELADFLRSQGAVDGVTDEEIQKIGELLEAGVDKK